MDSTERRDGIPYQPSRQPLSQGPDGFEQGEAGIRGGSAGVRGEPAGGPDGVTGGVPGAGVVSLEQEFDASTLFALRSAVAAHASHLGASERGVLDVTLVAHELASNAIQHGGGHGRLRMWRERQYLYCEVTDHGTGLTVPEPGRHLVEPLAPGGRGLWLIRRLSDEMHIMSGPTGARVTAVVPVEPLPLEL